jgi:hypothetical protein
MEYETELEVLRQFLQNCMSISDANVEVGMELLNTYIDETLQMIIDDASGVDAA